MDIEDVRRRLGMFSDLIPSPELALKREIDSSLENMMVAVLRKNFFSRIALQQTPPKKVKCVSGSSPGDH